MYNCRVSTLIQYYIIEVKKFHFSQLMFDRVVLLVLQLSIVIKIYLFIELYIRYTFFCKYNVI